jgi:hypothetical protein
VSTCIQVFSPEDGGSMLLWTSFMKLQTQRMSAPRQLSFERHHLFVKRLIPEDSTFLDHWTNCCYCKPAVFSLCLPST